MSPAAWAVIGIVVVILLACGYVHACRCAVESLDWEDERED